VSPHGAGVPYELVIPQGASSSDISWSDPHPALYGQSLGDRSSVWRARKRLTYVYRHAAAHLPASALLSRLRTELSTRVAPCPHMLAVPHSAWTARLNGRCVMLFTLGGPLHTPSFERAFANVSD